MVDDRRGSYEYPIAENGGWVRRQLCETAATFDLRPSPDAEADMLLEMKAIQQRLRVGIPRLHREMDALLERIHIPGTL